MGVSKISNGTVPAKNLHSGLSQGASISNGTFLSTGESFTVVLGSTYRGVLFVNGFGTSESQGIYMLACRADGTLIQMSTVKQASGVGITFNGGQMTITNNWSGGSIYFTFLNMYGNITKAS